MQTPELRCQEYYQARFNGYLNRHDPGRALDECLHDFLDQRPQGKYTARNRASGLVAAGFWLKPSNLEGTQIASLALARVLHFDDVISKELLDHLAVHHPDVLRWAIRYSKLFTRSGSPLWKHLRETQSSYAWQEFFGVCDRLLQQLEPFDEAILQAEHRLKSLSLLELLSYLSVLAYGRLGKVDDDPAGKDWGVYERIVLRKLKVCTESDFRLSEEVLGRSLKRHLSPMLFPQPGGGAECSTHLESVAVLAAAMRERIDYEGSIDWFCYDSECDYQLRPGQSVIFNKTDEGTQRWQHTERKSQLLWCYWMRRAIELFAASDMAGKTIGSPENHEANQLAYIKAVRSQLYLQVVFGLGERVRLNDGTEVALHHAMLASELSRTFFEQAFLQPYHRYLDDLGDPIAALRRLAFEGLLQGENRFPMTWSELPDKVRRIRAWTVSDEHPEGDADAAKAILQFWTSDLQMLSAQIKQTANMPTPRLYEQPFYKIGRYSFQFPWIAGRQNSLTAAINNLRRVNARRADMQAETRRVELVLAESFRRRGFAVEVGYRPLVTEEDDAGEVDLICHQDGVVLLLEVKSGYIRSTKHEVWLHRTNTLRKAAWQLRRKQVAVLGALKADQELRSRLGYHGQELGADMRSWIVDTSIELDGQSVDGFRVVSREALEVILRDEKQLLRPTAQLDEERRDSLFPDGFTAGRFIAVVESNELWRGMS